MSLIDATPGITAIAQQLPVVIEKLTTAGHDDIALLLSGLQVDIQQIVSGELMVIKAAEDPLLSELKAWRELITGGFEGAVNGNIPFTIRPIVPKQ